MKAIMIMFDTLNRHFLPNYGCTDMHAPQFERLGRHSVTFDCSYTGSLPCMPARREIHTGRLNFLHRGWTPLEPFDDSMPEMLKKAGIYSHLTSDHQHYWEDGGATYHTRYSSWEIARGQEGDPWKADLSPDVKNSTSFGMMPAGFAPDFHRQDVINRAYMKDETMRPQAVTFENGLAFLDINHEHDNWFLQIETFDPHEPFYSTPEYEALYPDDTGYTGPDVDWPPYAPMNEDDSDEKVRYIRRKYKALISMCDNYLGKVLDAMDRHDLWKDTMLIVNTDHGYLLGEHQWWSKSIMPLYEELCHTPLFIWDPRSGKRDERRQALVQTIDLAPTLLEYFGVPRTGDMQGFPLRDVIASDTAVRQYALLGYFGSHVNVTDGRYIYMRAPMHAQGKPLYEYTLMPTHMRGRFAPEELCKAELSGPFSFTKGCPVLKIPSEDRMGSLNAWHRFGNKLYDVQADPRQECPLADDETEARMINAMLELMRENDAPPEQYQRLGLPREGIFTPQDVAEEHAKEAAQTGPLPQYSWEGGAAEMMRVLGILTADSLPVQKLYDTLDAHLRAGGKDVVHEQDILVLARQYTPEEKQPLLLYLLHTAARRD